MPSQVARMRLAQAVESQFDTSVTAAFEAILAAADEAVHWALRPSDAPECAMSAARHFEIERVGMDLTRAPPMTRLCFGAYPPTQRRSSGCPITCTSTFTQWRFHWWGAMQSSPRHGIG